MPTNVKKNFIGKPPITGWRKWTTIWPVLLMVCFLPVRALVSLALSGDYYNYLLLIPVISGVIIYLDRNRIFQTCVFSPRWGGALGLLGIVLLWSENNLPAKQATTYGLSLSVFSAIIMGAAGFLACFGTQAFRRAMFPLGFLLLMVPFPPNLMNDTVLELQSGSATCSAILFRLLQVPALREGMRFSLPGLEIVIREHCSGTRSTLGLCIASILASHFFIRTWWKQLLLVVLTIPVVIFKNAVRIVTTSLLGIYVDRRFLNGPLHNYGGLLFSLLDLLILTPILFGLYRSDDTNWKARRSTPC